MQHTDATSRPSADVAEPPTLHSHSVSSTTNRSHGKSSDSKDDENALLSDSTLGQFSFAPATQTTVVTTTTTTTTKFPPFLMRPPRNLHSLDPKLYPLASSQTPSSLKNICFTFGGKPSFFKEAEDTSVALDQLKRQQAALKASNGSVQSKVVSKPRYEHPGRPGSTRNGIFNRRAYSKRLRERPMSPVSMSEVADPSSQASSAAPRPFINFPSVRFSASTGPATPDTDNGNVARDPFAESRRPFHPTESSRRPRLDQSPSLDSVPQQQNNLQALSPRHFDDSAEQFSSIQATPLQDRHAMFSSQTSGNISDNNMKDESDVSFNQSDLDEMQARASGQQVRRGPSSIPPRLSAFESPASQDISLPSPSLSPVTAAANLHSAEEFFLPHEIMNEMDPTFDLPSRQHPEAMEMAPTAKSHDSHSGFFDSRSPASMTDIPAMFDFFEAIPDDLKKYVMHQLLRRCPKPTLHYVADMVNPALKCDFLSLLPLELSLNIVGYLDVKSMCRASQVCRRWRHIINSDEKAWKELLDEDGFAIEDGELRRAIVEGWGWQHPSSIDGFETLLPSSSGAKSDSEESSSALVSRSLDGQTSDILSALAGSRRPKRKAATRASSRKQFKRKADVDGNPEKLAETADWMAALAASEGPYAAANAAALAVPYPNVGLPSLKCLHLFKSIYQRNYLIRQNWIREDVKPRHIAFRAHDRHVVTCLQFDTDKILTGSDDTNINVYDTKTGALRATLQGHEGGVWALQYEGNVLVSGSTDRSVRVWDIDQAKCIQVFHGHTSTVRCLQILMPVETGRTADKKPIMTPKQPLIITGSRDSNLRVWKLPQPSDPNYVHSGPPQDDVDCPYFVRTLSGHQHSVRAIAAHADTLVSGSYDCSVRVWKISTGETVHRLTGHAQKVYSVVLDHQRNRCISGSMDNLVKIWSLDTGNVLYNLEGHTSLVGLLDLNCDRLVSAAADCTLRIWDPESGQCKSILRAHTGAITCFQHDGQKVISGSDRTLKMWNVRTGQCVRDLLTELSGVWQVKFNDRRLCCCCPTGQSHYIEVLDFGACRDSFTEDKRGRRIVVNSRGNEIKPFLATVVNPPDAEE